MAADIPSERDELTRANDFCMAECSSSWLKSAARNTPTDLHTHTQPHEYVIKHPGTVYKGALPYFKKGILERLII